MKEEKMINKERTKSLRVVFPQLYQSILAELEKLNIHSYDMQINAEKQKDGVRLILQFGENFTHQKTQFFTYEAIENNSSEMTKFVKVTGEACKEVMINEYFKKMRP